MSFALRQQFGRYVAVESPLHALDPAVKILVFAVVLASVFLASNYVGLGAVAAGVVALCGLSRIRAAFYFQSLKCFLWMFALALAINVIFPRGGLSQAFTGGALAAAGLATGRLVLMILAATAFTMVTNPSELGDTMVSLAVGVARSRGRAGRKAADFAAVVSMALRFVPVMLEEAERVRAAQVLRGAARRGLRGRVRSLAEVIVPLVESSLRRSANLAFALDARCYGFALPAARAVRVGVNEAGFLAGSAALVWAVLALR
ncbi:MAG: energy-coupling factor transporter transmembrane protein EcfT [bacterium]